MWEINKRELSSIGLVVEPSWYVYKVTTLDNTELLSLKILYSQDNEGYILDPKNSKEESQHDKC